MNGEDSQLYNQELTLYAQKIILQCKTNNINFSSLSLRDLIWVQTVYLLLQEQEMKGKEYQYLKRQDSNFLLFDLCNTQRVKAAGKVSAALKLSELPSQKYKLQKKLKQVTVQDKKRFLQSMNKKFNK